MSGSSDKDHIQNLKNALSSSVDIMNALVDLIPRKINKEMLAIPAIYLTMCELADAMNILYANDKLNQIPVLLRSFVDSLYDLKLLFVNPDNIGNLNAKAVSEDIKLYQLQLDPRNPDSTIANDPDRKKRILENLKMSKKTLAELGRKRIQA